MFTRASIPECQQLPRTLSRYEEASWQKINLEKTELSFSRNVREVDKNAIAYCLGVAAIESQQQYLGLLMMGGYSKKKVFSLVLDRLRKRIGGWEEKALSWAGQNGLIKAVIQAIPTYIMNCFLLPKSLCNDLSLLVNKFWWGSSDCKRKIHCASWGKHTRSKADGGLEVRDLQPMSRPLCSGFFRLAIFPGSHTWEPTLAITPAMPGEALWKQGSYWKKGPDGWSSMANKLIYGLTPGSPSKMDSKCSPHRYE